MRRSYMNQNHKFFFRWNEITLPKKEEKSIKHAHENNFRVENITVLFRLPEMAYNGPNCILHLLENSMAPPFVALCIVLSSWISRWRR